MVFNGRDFAAQIEQQVRDAVGKMPHKLKLASLYDENNPGAARYTLIKRKKAEELGIEFIGLVDEKLFEQYNKDQNISGIMIQLPFPNSKELINQIDPKKDVDGLREDSSFKPAVVRAVREILASEKIKGGIVVVGSKGVVGRALMKEFPGAVGMDKEDFNTEKIKLADILISATGQEGLIKPEMVKEGVVAIDLGFPKGDFSPEVAKSAVLFTPVPGGVGPVTVAMLFKNLTEASEVVGK